VFLFVILIYGFPADTAQRGFAAIDERHPMREDPIKRPAPTPLKIVIAMGLVSFAALAYEVTLTRVFSFVTGYHFVYLVIGLAVLGYGAAGSFHALRGRVTPGVLSVGAMLFAVAGIGAVLGLSSIAFDPGAVFTDPGRQLVSLVILTLVVFVPFLGAGLVIGGIIARHGSDAGRVYAFDLVGAGLGSAATPAMLEWLGAPALAGALSVLLGGAAFLIAPSRGFRVAAAVSVAVPAAFLGLVAMNGEPEYRVPPTKPYHYLKATGVRFEHRRWSALPRIDVTAPSRVTVFGFGGDLAEKYRDTKWELRGVLQDGTAYTAMLGLEDVQQIDTMDFLGGFLQGSAFPLRRGGSALVIGVGGGIDVLIALHEGIRRVVGVEMNPFITELLTDRYRDFTGGLAADPRVELVTAEGRLFLSTTHERFDAIQLSGVDTFAALSSGAFAVAEAYLYTVEAVEALFDRLKPGGILSYSRHVLEPPRETIRNASNMVAAFARRGMDDCRDRILIVAGRGWANCMAKPDGFTPEELARVRTWAEALGFRLLYDPERRGSTAFDRLIRARPETRRAFLYDYHYDISPTTDERPFFFQYGKPSKLFDVEEGVSLKDDWPLYIPSALATLLVSLAVMAACSTLFILVPVAVAELGRRRRGRPGTPGAPRFRVLVYFSALGLGFLFVEIALMQQFTVFLGNPTQALTVILFALLASSGLGSATSRRFSSGRILLVIPVLIVVYAVGLRYLISGLLGSPLPLRIALVVATVAPLGFVLGNAFPLGIRALSVRRPGLLPWAFAVNACFTVLGSAGAVVLALLFGFPATLVAAAIVYLVAASAFRRLEGGLERGSTDGG